MRFDSLRFELSLQFIYYWCKTLYKLKLGVAVVAVVVFLVVVVVVVVVAAAAAAVVVVIVVDAVVVVAAVVVVVIVVVVVVVVVNVVQCMDPCKWSILAGFVQGYMFCFTGFSCQLYSHGRIWNIGGD